MNQPANSSKNNNCNMVGLLGIIIQLGLGVLSFSVLLVKRCRQIPPRPWKIWIFDTSKQLVSQMLAHFINLTISIALTYEDKGSDQCLWYFITNILDNTIGVLICVFCLIYAEKIFIKKGKLEYVSGNYYSTQKVLVTVEVMSKPLQETNKQSHRQQKEQKKQQNNIEIEHKSAQVSEQNEHNGDIELVEEHDEHDKDAHLQVQMTSVTEQVQKIHINYKAWLVQLLVWISIVVLGKILLFAFQFGLQDPLKNLSFTLMGWIEDYQILQLMVVIVVVPVIMNGLAFWVQDNFLKKHEELQPALIELVHENSQQKGQQKYEIM